MIRSNGAQNQKEVSCVTACWITAVLSEACVEVFKPLVLSKHIARASHQMHWLTLHCNVAIQCFSRNIWHQSHRRNTGISICTCFENVLLWAPHPACELLWFVIQVFKIQLRLDHHCGATGTSLRILCFLRVFWGYPWLMNGTHFEAPLVFQIVALCF